MAEKSHPGEPDDKSQEVGFQHTPYVPEEQLFQRIPLCRYLGDLSAFFENDDGADPSALKAEKEGES